MKPIELKTEYTISPLGIDTLEPRLSWCLESDKRGTKQQSYQILVSSNVETLLVEKGEIWNTGKIDSNQSFSIRYSGKTLVSGQRCYWTVRTWDHYNIPSDWSDPAWWEMGLLHDTDWQGQWIGGPENPTEYEAAAPLLRKLVQLDKPIVHARAYICGLGYHELWINGERIGNNVLDPGFTNYDQRTFYVTHDITSSLYEGINCFAVELGRGFYALKTPNVWNWEKASWNSEPKLLIQFNLKFEDGSSQWVTSDETWRTTSGPRLKNSLYSGEVYDANLEKPGWTSSDYDDTDWTLVTLIESSPVKLQSQIIPPIQIIDTVQPSRIHLTELGNYIVDFGINIVGWVEFQVQGSKGTSVQLRYGEKLNPDESVYNENSYVSGESQTDHYILHGNGLEVWEPAFSYKGFRYVELINWPEVPEIGSIIGKVVRSSVRKTGTFSCSNPLLNQIYEATSRTILNNLHSIPTDTPVYEKNGWTGDAHLIAETANYNFDLLLFWEKWVQDIQDCQKPDGAIPLIVPASTWGWDHAPVWTSVYVLIPWYLYMHYGDRSVLEHHYTSMKVYADWEISKLNADHTAHSVLGDWVPPGSKDWSAPEGTRLMASAYAYHILKTVVQIAEVVGTASDVEQYTHVAKNIAKSFHKTFFNRDAGIYETEIEAGYRQASNIIPLAFGLTPSEDKAQVVLHLLNDIINVREKHLNTGIIGTKYILPVLTDLGFGELAYAIADQKTYPSWGFWLENGIHTLLEEWELKSRSQNHYMFGTVVEWFFKYLAGIQIEKPGYQSFKVMPHILGPLSQVSSQIETLYGQIKVSWQLSIDGNFSIEVTVPANCQATIFIPTLNSHEVTESGVALRLQDEVIVEDMDLKEYVVCKVQSGTYHFRSCYNRVHLARDYRTKSN
ncbi:glycoside hydrolase family 78 protein [Paenibacillus sp. HWE-109]|uniref:alpha-L-rhamnosidase n=1 Tax=Paenibacillus sp. HWE-109 TaxID=1306526 RepID=UPI001EE0B9E9|nr:alpha-L-rhamnosidase [Paenibacillus sp. HWE-109]UKS28308.1 glycoside hydrolase family 78 protein [Paenibacillus sp. HWE-109]